MIHRGAVFIVRVLYFLLSIPHDAALYFLLSIPHDAALYFLLSIPHDAALFYSSTYWMTNFYGKERCKEKNGQADALAGPHSLPYLFRRVEGISIV